MAALKKLPAAYWILILISTLAESLFIPFLDNGNKYYMQVFKGVDEPEQAGFYLVVPYVVGALLVPPIGILVEKIPFRSITIIATCFSFFLTYAFIFFMETSSSMREE